VRTYHDQQEAAVVALLGLATAVPPYALDQDEVTARARRIYARAFERLPKLAEVFTNAGIKRRYSARPLDWFDKPHDWRDRTQAYLAGAQDLFVAAAEAALMNAGVTASDVDAVVTVSSTGIATPSLEARVAGRLGLRMDVSRVPVFGLGCAGGVSGLSLGARLARAAPGKAVLVVVVELCTLAFRADRDDNADVISAALFGDGAAAVVLRAGDERVDARTAVRIGRAREHTWPDTLDIMGWSVDPAGFGVVLSRSLPRFVEQYFAAPAREFAGDPLPAGTHYVVHPGGAKVLDAVEGALNLAADDMDDARSVLSGYGNMSAPTVLFVLERALRRGLGGAAVMAALGPGFTASFLSLELPHG
jgi:alkylresorcinol/alkylpyrone synthase